MQVIRTIKELSVLEKSKTVVLVPTMGALHEGHRKLIQEGSTLKTDNVTLVVSIYINPIQFNDAVDLEKYPRTIDEDYKMCEEEGVDIIFMPSDQRCIPADHR